MQADFYKYAHVVILSAIKGVYNIFERIYKTFKPIYNIFERICNIFDRIYNIFERIYNIFERIYDCDFKKVVWIITNVNFTLIFLQHFESYLDDYLTLHRDAIAFRHRCFIIARV